MKSNWYEDFFHGVANDLWRQCITPEGTRAEADFLEALLGPKTRLLDVPCGNGRHSLELTRRGCRVTGLDISAEFIDEAQSASRTANLPADFVLGNMKQIPWTAEFDGAFCFGNSFGYLERPDMATFLTGVFRALKPGGRFVIETGMVAESVIPHFCERESYQVGDIHCTLDNHYLADLSCVEAEYTFVRAGTTEKRQDWHWVYTVAEIRRMFEQAGFEVAGLYGGLDRKPYQLGDRLLFVVAEKRSDPPPKPQP